MIFLIYELKINIPWKIWVGSAVGCAGVIGGTGCWVLGPKNAIPLWYVYDTPFGKNKFAGTGGGGDEVASNARLNGWNIEIAHFKRIYTNLLFSTLYILWNTHNTYHNIYMVYLISIKQLITCFLIAGAMFSFLSFNIMLSAWNKIMEYTY